MKQIWAPEDGDSVIRGEQKGTVVNEEDAIAVDTNGNWQVYVRWEDEEDDEPDVEVAYSVHGWIA